ncbi:MAG: YfhO family protein [Anaerolineae bacterium]
MMASGNSQRHRRETLIVALLIPLAVAIFLWSATFGGQMLSPADLIFDLDPLWWPLTPVDYEGPSNALLADQVTQFLPWQLFARQWLSAWTLPLWNPYNSAGLPFIGNAQSAIFSPFHLLGYLFPTRLSLTITAVLRLSVACLFTYLFAREIGIGQWGAFLGATAFSFSGPMINWLGHPHSGVIAWFPGMLFTTERALTRKSVFYTLLCGMVIGAQFLGGHPETSFHVMVAWLGYGLYRVVTLNGWSLPRLIYPLAMLLGAATLGVSLAAIQLLPFVEALVYSATPAIRTQQTTAPLFVRLFLDWREWPTVVTAFLPRYFGTPLDGSYWYPYTNYIEQDMYAGILPLALALGAILGSIRLRSCLLRKQALFFGGLAIAAIGVALRVPLLNVVNFLPLFNLVANSRLRLIYVFAVAILAGIGLDRIRYQDAPTERWAHRALVSVTLLSLLLIAAAYFGFVLFRDQVVLSGRTFIENRWGSDPYLNRPLEYYYALVDERYEKKLALYRPAHIAMYLPMLVTLAWIVLLRFCKRVYRAVIPLAAVVLTFLDLFLVGRSFNPTVAPEEVLPTPGAIQFLQQDHSIYRVCGTGLILYPNVGMIFGLQDVRGYDTVVPRRYMALMDRLDGYYQYYFHSLFTRADTPLLDLLNVKYLLTDQEPDEKWELVYEDEGPVRVYRNRNVLPRAFVVYQVEIAKNSDESLERLVDEHFNFRERVILEQSPLNWDKPAQIPITVPEVRFLVYEPNRVLLEVRTEASGILVMTDNYAPGWKAFVDKRAVPIYIANHAFRAVVVPAGQHQVEFVYRPWSFYLGATLSLVTVITLLAGLIWCILKGKSEQ